MNFLHILICFLLLCISTNIGFTNGLAATGEIILNDLEIGKSYSFSKLRNSLFRVNNTGDEPVDIRLYLEQAKDSELKPGCNKLPDISWVKTEKTTLSISARGIGKSDVYIAIPDSHSYTGKKYQFYIVSETVPKGQGLVYGIALKSRVIFATLPKKDKQKVKKGFLGKLLNIITFWKKK